MGIFSKILKKQTKAVGKQTGDPKWYVDEAYKYLPTAPDPNKGYIRGSRFERKDYLERLTARAWFYLFYGVEPDIENSIAHAYRVEKITPHPTVTQSIKYLIDQKPIRVGKLLIDKKDESKGFLVVGRPGTGKTQLLSQVIDVLRSRHGKILIHDYKGDYLQYFYDEDLDLIFNPLDKRCVAWDIFNGVVGEWDLESMATALIPYGQAHDEHWTDAARNVLIGSMLYCIITGNANNAGLKSLISDIPRLVKILLDNNLRGSAHLVGFPDSKEAASVVSTFARYAQTLKYLPDTTTSDGSVSLNIRDWLLSDTGGTIFCVNYQATQDLLRPLLSLFIESFIRTVLSLPDDVNRRIYCLLDEFGQLNRVPSISSLITQGRSKGNSSWIGIQDLSQIETRYSRSVRESICNSLANHIVFNVSDAGTAKIFSDEIGDVTRVRKDYTESSSTGQNDSGSSSSYSQSLRETQITEKLVLPSEILNLPDLHCICKFVNRDISATKINIVKRETVAPAFVLNERYGFSRKDEEDKNEE